MSNTAWFVDGSYVFETWRSVTAGGLRLDYSKLRSRLESLYCENGERIGEAYYFGAELDPNGAARNSFHTFLTCSPPSGPGFRVKLYWLAKTKLYWPYQFGGGPVLHPETGVQYEQTQQKGVDVGLAFHLVRSFYRSKWKTLILGAGDGDFGEVVQHLVENEGVKVVGLGSEKNMSNHLRPYFSQVFSLENESERIAMDAV